MASVELQSVTKNFSAVAAVKDFGLSIGDGEFIVLVGASGCGKTTVLRMLTGLELPTSGTIRIGDRIVNDVAPRHRNVSMVFQGHALYPHKNVQQNMAFGLAQQGETRADVLKRVQHTAKLLGIDDLLTRQPHELSGGQQQRVALGCTLSSNPDVWLLDEPFSHLDAKLRFDLRSELATLQRDLRVTTILVTHDLSEAMSLADRIVVMDAGRLQQVGEPQDIYDRPSNRLVAESLSHPPMNFLSGKVDSVSGSRVIVSLHDSLRLEFSLPSHELQPSDDVDLGVRAECLQVADFSDDCPDTTDLRAEIIYLEPTGADSLLHLRCGGQRLVARVGNEWIARSPACVSLNIDPATAYLFDVKSGDRISS